MRSSARVDSELEVTLINETQKGSIVQATIKNMSAAGGRFECDQKMASIGDRFSMTLTLKMDEFEKLISIEGVVRNMGGIGEKGDDGNASSYWYGFNFEFDNEEEKVLLKGYVYQEILRSLHML